MSDEETVEKKHTKWDVAFTAPLELKVQFERVVEILAERYIEPPSQAAVLRRLLVRGINAELADAVAGEADE